MAAPAFRLPIANGWLASDSLRGKVVLVDFWASWCAPCKRSFPWLRHMQDTFGPQGFTVVGINVDKDRAAAYSFLARTPANFPIAFDPDGSTAEAFKVSGMPSTFLIGRDGAVVFAHVGFDPKKTPHLESLVKDACTR